MNRKLQFKIFNLMFLFSIIVFSCSEISAQVTNASAPLNNFCNSFTTDKSKFCVTFKVIKGKFAVDNTQFFPNEFLRKNYLPSISNPQNLNRLEKKLSVVVQTEMDQRGKPLCDLVKPKNKELCPLDQSWQAAQNNFQMPVLFKQKLLFIFSHIESNSALKLISEDETIPVEWQTATVVFKVENPIDDICDTDFYKD